MIINGAIFIMTKMTITSDQDEVTSSTTSYCRSATLSPATPIPPNSSAFKKIACLKIFSSTNVVYNSIPPAFFCSPWDHSGKPFFCRLKHLGMTVEVNRSINVYSRGNTKHNWFTVTFMILFEFCSVCHCHCFWLSSGCVLAHWEPKTQEFSPRRYLWCSLCWHIWKHIINMHC